MRLTGLSVCILGSILALVSPAAAQPAPVGQFPVTLDEDSGYVVNPGTERGVIFATIIDVPGADWLRLFFEDVDLGTCPQGGRETIVRVTSLLDQASQPLNALALKQWQNSCAYFNGGQLLVELVADPCAEPSRIVIASAAAGTPVGGGGTICGPTDDRILSSDPRCCRVMPIGCSGWLIDDDANCFLTAGHCTGNIQVVQFNVPLSTSGGGYQSPPPEDQYPIDGSSLQAANTGIGNDWAVFGCFPNTTTGLTAFEAQGDAFTLSPPPPVQGQQIRITGYGTTSSPIPPQWNGVQKTHSGPYASFGGPGGTTVTYTTDTTGGNSGSPVINEATGLAIGIHTNGGCNSGGGANLGTATNNSNFQNALDNPIGVCVVPETLEFQFPQGIPDLLDPAGAVIPVTVSGVNGGVPAPGTGKLHFDTGTGFLVVDMVVTGPNEYDAVFPPLACPSLVTFYVSAETTNFELETFPGAAPSEFLSAISALEAVAFFEDDFEDDLGWTTASTAATGQWQRGVPLGGGDRGDPATDADGSGSCWVTGLVDGDNDVDDGMVQLISPNLDASGGNAFISYFRWFSNDTGANPNEDVLTVQISSNGGGSWVLLEAVGPNPPGVSGGWIPRSFRVSDFVIPTDQVRVRFTASDANNSASVIEAGVDGFSLDVFTCFPGDLFSRGDTNSDGIHNIVDAMVLLNFLFGGGSVVCERALDANDDETIGLEDAVSLLGATFGTLPFLAQPFPSCGVDSTPGGLGCGSFPGCP